jgi:hypothetical protein
LGYALSMKLQEMSTRTQGEWRRNQIFELSSKDHSQADISKPLQISESTISKDLDYLKQQSKENIRKYIDERLLEKVYECIRTRYYYKGGGPLSNSWLAC